MFEQIPTEISIGSIYFPPFFFTVMWGFVCAIGISKLLGITGMNSWFWNPGLTFVALWVLATSLIGLTLLPASMSINPSTRRRAKQVWKKGAIKNRELFN